VCSSDLNDKIDVQVFVMYRIKHAGARA
jgi:hypothetical protein